MSTGTTETNWERVMLKMLDQTRADVEKEIVEAVQKVHDEILEALRKSQEDLQNSIDMLQRILDSRTEEKV